MNDRLEFDNLSPAGEEVDRVQRTCAAPAWDAELLVEIVRMVFHICPAKIEAIPCLSELLRDLHSQDEPDSEWAEWVAALRLCKTNLEASLRKTESQARLVMPPQPSGAVRMMTARFSSRLNSSQQSELRRLRARIVLVHLSKCRPISNDMGSEVARLIAGRNPAMLELCRRVRDDRGTLIDAQKQYLPTSPEAKFITSLLDLLDIQLTTPPVLANKCAASMVSSADASSDDQDTGDAQGRDGTQASQSPPVADAPPTKWDLTEEMVRQETYARARDRSGTTKSWARLETFELESAAKKFIADLQTADWLNALIALLCVFLHFFPGNYGSLGLCDTGDVGVWLDLQKGCLCWRLESVIDRERWLRADRPAPTRAPVLIPLPFELWEKLLALLRANPNAETLADLIPGDLKKAESDARSYVKRISVSSHRVTMGRLCSSFGGFILAVSGDETYARALGMDLTLGASASLNYFVLRAERVNQILRECFVRLGFKGQLSHDVVTDTGSRFTGVIENLGAMVRETLQSAVDAFARALPSRGEAVLIAAHNVIAMSVLVLLIVTTGARAAKDFCFAAHTMDLDVMLAILADKEIMGIRAARIVPLPKIVVAWLEFYFQWLDLLKGRLQRLNPRASELIDSISRNANGRAAIPLFFHLGPGFEIRPFQNSDLAEIFRLVGLETNAGRHLGDYVLREGGGDSALVSAWLGHGGNGLEVFGVFSLLDPMNTFDSMRKIFDKYWDSQCLPAAPALKKPQTSKKRFSGKGDYIPGGFKGCADGSTSEPAEGEDSPFGEFTLAHMREFSEIARQWEKAARAAAPGELIADLIVKGGLVDEEVLMSTAIELLSGSVWEAGRDHIVHAIAKTTGIHRVWPDPASVRMASKISARGIEMIRLRKLANAVLASLCAEAGITCAAEDLLTMVLVRARAFYALRLPGLLRGIMFGEIAARTSRIETLARERLDLVEHPSIRSGRRQRSAVPVPDGFIMDEIKFACGTAEYRGTGKTRIKNLGDRLRQWDGKPFDHPVTQVLLTFVLYLTELPIKPVTVKRYYDALRRLILCHCHHISSVDELFEIDWVTAAKEFEAEFPTKEGEDTNPAMTALNHFFKAIKLDVSAYQEQTPFTASFKFTDFLSSAECTRARELIPQISTLSAPRTFQACVMFGIFESVSPRSLEASRARVIDVSSQRDPHITITHEAVGVAKSVNADRVLEIKGDKLARMLSDLVDARIKQSGNDVLSFLFGDSANLKSVYEIDQILDLIKDAIFAVSGSEHVSAHSFRAAAATGAVKAMLDPANRKNCSTLALRNGLYLLAYLLGHGHPGTTIANYVCLLDEALRNWVRAIREASIATPSRSFMSSLTGIKADTLGARERRDSVLAVVDPFEGFDPDANPDFSTRIRAIKHLVVPDTKLLIAEPFENIGNSDKEIALFTAARVAGIDEDSAAFLSQIHPRVQAAVNAGLAQIFSAAGQPFVCPPIAPSQITENLLLRNVATSLAGWQPEAAAALGICRMMSQDISQPWKCRDSADASAALVPLDQLDRALVTSVFSSAKGAFSDVDAMRRFQRSGHVCLERSSREFRRDEKFRIQFVPAGTASKALPVHVRKTTFLVTTAVLARCAFSIGVNKNGS